MMKRGSIVLPLSLLALLGSGCSLLFDGNDLHGNKGGTDGGLDAGMELDGATTDLASGADLTPLPLDAGPITNITFAITPVVFETSNGGVGGLALGDLNGDGHVDIAIANDTEATLSVLLGKGDGTFTKVPLGYPVCPMPSYGPSGVAIGNFNSDTKLDVAISCNPNSTLEGALSVALNQGNDASGNPLFTVTTKGSLGFALHAVAAGDFDKDGSPDLVVIDGQVPAGVPDPSKVYLSIFFGSTTGAFAAPLHYATGLAGAPRDILVGDLNNDGRLDIVALSDADNKVEILVNRGGARAGLFGATLLDTDSGAGPTKMALADLTADGTPADDLVVADSGFGGPYQSDVFLNSYKPTMGVFPDGGVLNPLTSYSASINPRSVVVGDFNRDGTLDFVLGWYDFNTVSTTGLDVFLGTGAGAFTQKQTINPSKLPTETMVVGDFNGDGLADIASGASGTPQVYVMLNTSH